MKTELENINVLQTQDLGGHNPKKVVQIEEDDNYKIEIDIKKIYEVKKPRIFLSKKMIYKIYLCFFRFFHAEIQPIFSKRACERKKR